MQSVDEPVVARVVCSGFEPESWLLLLVEHRFGSLQRQHPEIQRCIVEVSRTAFGWFVALRFSCGTEQVSTLAGAVGLRPKDVMIPMQEVFVRALRSMRHRASARPIGRVLPPVRFVLRVETPRTEPP